MLLRPPPEAHEIAESELARLKDCTRAELLRYEQPRNATVTGRSGRTYEVELDSFLDSTDPESDLFVNVRVRPSGTRLYRAAKAGLVVDESQLWHRVVLTRLRGRRP